MHFLSDIIDLWPSPTAFAEDLGVKIGIVRVWKHRKAIPSKYWIAIELAASQRGIEQATVRDLALVEASQSEAAEQAA